MKRTRTDRGRPSREPGTSPSPHGRRPGKCCSRTSERPDRFAWLYHLLCSARYCPPTGLEQSPTYAEDIAFAHREGARRLQTLCAKARAHLQTHRGEGGASTSLLNRRTAGRVSHPVQTLPSEVKQNILELLGAIEWLFWISHFAAIATTGPTSFDLDYASVNKYGLLRDPVDGMKSRGNEHNLQDSIVIRAQSKQEPVTTL